ncbi:TPA: fimbrial protein [Salmonella enterica subsp. enterica serovar Reading]
MNHPFNVRTLHVVLVCSLCMSTASVMADTVATGTTTPTGTFPHQVTFSGRIVKSTCGLDVYSSSTGDATTALTSVDLGTFTLESVENSVSGSTPVSFAIRPSNSTHTGCFSSGSAESITVTWSGEHLTEKGIALATGDGMASGFSINMVPSAPSGYLLDGDSNHPVTKDRNVVYYKKSGDTVDVKSVVLPYSVNIVPDMNSPRKEGVVSSFITYTVSYA